MAVPKNQNLMIERWDYRLTFAKIGRARYISHLDLMRTMTRAIKRAKIPIWYTQGFNPHAYLMFPLALSLGIDSEIESMDIALIEDMPFKELIEKLNSAMPQGLYFISAARPVKKNTDIAAAEYLIEISFDVPAEKALEKWHEFTDRDTIEIEKRVKPKKGRKAGTKLVDIKPHLNVLQADIKGEKLCICIQLPAGNELNINTSTITDAFCKFAEVEIAEIYTKRTKILCSDGENFT